MSRWLGQAVIAAGAARFILVRFAHPELTETQLLLQHWGTAVLVGFGALLVVVKEWRVPHFERGGIVRLTRDQELRDLRYLLDVMEEEAGNDPNLCVTVSRELVRDARKKLDRALTWRWWHKVRPPRHRTPTR